MGGGSSPPPPTPQAAPSTAADQLNYNVSTASTGQAASMVDQSNPWGSLTYNQTGTGPNGIPIYSANTSLTPQMQQIIDQLQGGVSNQLTSSNYLTGDASKTIGDMTSGWTKDLLDKQVSYLSPFFTEQSRALDTQLRNQGISPFDPAYKTAMNNLGQTQNQSVTGFLAQAGPQAFNMARESYLTPLQIAQGLMGMNNPSSFMSGLVNPPQANVGNVNYGEMVNSFNQAEMAKYKAAMEQKQAMMSGMFGIPTAILGGWARTGGVQALGSAMLPAMAAM